MLLVATLAAPPAAAAPSGDITFVHDPSIAHGDGAYWIFSTGAGIPVRRSTDLETWSVQGRVFASDLPAWASTEIPRADIPWAPDISYFAGAWHVYYAVSTFGSKISVIGLATSPSLEHPEWTDHGVVVRSTAITADPTNDYNAIDPNVFIDDDGSTWLAWGSAFGGIKLSRLDPSTGMLADRRMVFPLAVSPVINRVIEAAFLVKRDGYYYLFVSYDACCRGVDSTYNIRVGRSLNLLGPYLDDTGVPMLAGGGRLVLASHDNVRGPGHNAVLHEGDDWRLVFHYYDADNAGVPTLGILPITWTADGWPTV
jgi:arabinan endo-1,5-alpha-L-arabinosidase